MLSVKEYGDHGPLLVMIHWLGGSSRSWHEVCEAIAPHGVRCVAVDLPGFGPASDSSEFSVAGMADLLVDTVRFHRAAEASSPWFLAGHSMGGKLAAIAARAAENQVEGLQNLCGVVLLSPSPPSPEPMDASTRDKMLESLGEPSFDATENRTRAEKFVDDNTGKLPLVDAARERTVEDVLRMNPKALVAWLKTGSKEDWSAHVGVLTTPALVMAGTEEKALGPSAQQQHTLQHFAHAALVPLDGGGHLTPLERPLEVADRMMEFFRGLVEIQPQPSVPSDGYLALIESDRTSPQTREVLLQRMDQDSSEANALLPEELRTLRALASRVAPDVAFDLASDLNTLLAHSKRDGWRFKSLPDDAAAWKQGLFSLDAAAKREFGVPFIALDSARQDDLLKQAHQGKLGGGTLAALHLGDGVGAFSASQMRDWFEDVRGELVELYVSNPLTLERIGFTGFADEQGFTQIRLSQREEFEI